MEELSRSYQALMTRARVAIIKSFDSEWSQSIHRQVEGLYYDSLLLDYYRQFWNMGIPVDFVTAEEELDVLILKANNFLNVGEFEKSKEYFKKALEILDKEKNKTELASIYLTISEIYKSVGKLDRSLEYSQRVYDIKKSDEDEYMMKSLFRIIETYISNYKYDMAKKYCKIALASSIKNKNRLNEYRVLKYYSDMHKAQNENIIAIEYLHKCINIISELNDEKILADLYINLGELYSDISKEKELEYYQKGVCIYKNLEII